MVSFTPRPLYSLERAPVIHWIGGWVGPQGQYEHQYNNTEFGKNNPKPSLEAAV